MAFPVVSLAAQMYTLHVQHPRTNMAHELHRGLEAGLLSYQGGAHIIERAVKTVTAMPLPVRVQLQV